MVPITHRARGVHLSQLIQMCREAGNIGISSQYSRFKRFIDPCTGNVGMQKSSQLPGTFGSLIRVPGMQECQYSQIPGSFGSCPWPHSMVPDTLPRHPGIPASCCTAPVDADCVIDPPPLQRVMPSLPGASENRGISLDGGGWGRRTDSWLGQPPRTRFLFFQLTL